MEERRLPVGYYLRNVETVIEDVCARYADLLHPEELQLLTAFRSLPEPARRLYVRMLTRKGPWFRLDGLNYAEIGDPRPVAATLVQAGFLRDDAQASDWLPLLTRADLLDHGARLGLPVAKAMRRDALVQVLSEAPDAVLAAHLQAHVPLVGLRHEALWTLLFFLFFLFFGNGEQDLSSFVLADIGQVRYERYPIDLGARLFETRSDVDFLLSVRALREALVLAAAAAEADPLEALMAQVLTMDPHPGIRQQRRHHRLLNELGLAWERRKEPARALACYARSQLPPARERSVRLHADLPEACVQAMGLAAEPLDPSEERFARVFLSRHARRVPAAAQWLVEHPAPPPVPVRHLLLPRQPSVEQAALEAAQAEGWAGFFAENLLWNALFGLVFWEELFAPVPGAFQHPFQSAPLDIHHPDFYTRRKEALEARLAEILDRQALLRRVLDTAERKWGVANAFLSWRHLSLEMLRASAERVPPAVFVEVLRRMARNPHGYACGFPDLFLYRGADWALWEVKGPGDTLRSEQDRWLRCFGELGCDVSVARVRWQNSSSEE